MTLEAAAGKNPVNHVGKLYSVLATDMAESLSGDHPEIKDITITLLSQIGKPIDRPKVASVSIIADEGDYGRLKPLVERGIDSRLETITEITAKIVEGKAKLF